MTFDDFWILMMCEPLCLLGVWTARVGSNPPLATKMKMRIRKGSHFCFTKEKRIGTQEIVRWCQAKHRPNPLRLLLVEKV